jgi:Cft2 family RNA processing exonuclease
MQFKSYYSGSSGNLHHVIGAHGGNILIDPGVTLQKVQHSMRFKIDGIDAAIISHSHKDHCKAVPGLMKRGVDCYMTKETADALKVSGHCLKIIESMKQISLWNWDILPFETQHDCPGSVGFVMSDGNERLVYITDSFYIKNRFAGINILSIECNYSEKTWSKGIHPSLKKRIIRSHFSLENVIDFIKANDMSGCREIHLIHISKSNGNPAMFVEEVQRLTGIPTYAH